MILSRFPIRKHGEVIFPGFMGLKGILYACVETTKNTFCHCYTLHFDAHEESRRRTQLGTLLQILQLMHPTKEENVVIGGDWNSDYTSIVQNHSSNLLSIFRETREPLTFLPFPYALDHVYLSPHIQSSDAQAIDLQDSDHLALDFVVNYSSLLQSPEENSKAPEMYVVIQSKMNGFVLTAPDLEKNANLCVTEWNGVGGTRVSQVWRWESGQKRCESMRIRGHFITSISDGSVSVSLKESLKEREERLQQWVLPEGGSGYIENSLDGRVLDINRCDPRTGADVILWKKTGFLWSQPNQLWKIIPVNYQLVLSILEKENE